MYNDLSDKIIGKTITGYCINNVDESIEIFLDDGNTIYIETN